MTDMEGHARVLAVLAGIEETETPAYEERWAPSYTGWSPWMSCPRRQPAKPGGKRK